jgi:hypothetical protein
MASKGTPKSCSCRMCRYSKSSSGGKFMMKADERAHRHRSNQELRVRLEDADLLTAVHGIRVG